MRQSTNAKLLPVLAMGVALAWMMYDSSPVFAQRSRDTSRTSLSSRDRGASLSRGTSRGASTSRSSFNPSGRSLGSPSGIPRGTRNLTPSLRSPAPRSTTIVPEIRKPAAQSKTIVPNLRNLPSAHRGLSANDRSPSRGLQTFPSQRIVLPPRGKEQPAIHASSPSLSKDRSAGNRSPSPSFRVYPLRENVVSRNDALSAPDGRGRSSEWNDIRLTTKRRMSDSAYPPVVKGPKTSSSTHWEPTLAVLPLR